MALIKTYSDNTTISGIGDTETRKNEITGDDLAVFRNFVIGYTSYKNIGGVLNYEGHAFDYSVDGNTVHLTDGFAFAYGYGGHHKAESITLLPPAVEQYYIIYLVFDKSIIPNNFEIKVKSNYSSPNYGANSLRQDQLSTVKTGVFEMPLWLFKITNKGVDKDSFIDLRPKNTLPDGSKILRNALEKVRSSDIANTVLSNGKLENEVTAVTQPITDNSKKIATTEFVRLAVQAEINK